MNNNPERYKQRKQKFSQTKNLFFQVKGEMVFTYP